MFRYWENYRFMILGFRFQILEVILSCNVPILGKLQIYDFLKQKSLSLDCGSQLSQFSLLVNTILKIEEEKNTMFRHDICQRKITIGDLGAKDLCKKCENRDKRENAFKKSPFCYKICVNSTNNNIFCIRLCKQHKIYTICANLTNNG